jgi:hypothetical protein
MVKIPVYHIKCYIRTGMAEMTFAAHGGATHIHAYMSRCDRDKNFLLPAIRIMDL